MTVLDPETRASLIARICDRKDDAAWTEFVTIYLPVIERFVHRKGLQHADTAEVVQEVLSRVAQSIETWDQNQPQSTFRGWLYRITRNLTIDFLRKKKVERAKSGGQQDCLEEVACPMKSDSLEFRDEFERELFQWAAAKVKPLFKPANWQAFWSSTVEGKPIEDVAHSLGLDCSAVYVARSRIMSKLAKLIQDRMQETDLL